MIEGQADRQELGPCRKALKDILLSELVTRYRDEVVSKKRSSEVETIILNRFLQDPICRKPLSDLTTADFAAYRDKRLKEPRHQNIAFGSSEGRKSSAPITAKSLKRQLSPLSNMFRHASVEWEIPVSNPLDALKLRVIDNKRERRLQSGDIRPDGTRGPSEEERLIQSARKCRNTYVLPIILFALETAMRRGEILAIQFRHVDFERSSLVIPESKSGYSRVIPLTNRAIAILSAVKKDDARGTDRAFPTTALALRLAWDKLLKRAGLDDLNFHDLRHEAISRLFELGLTVPEVASISGHRTLAQLMRYSHANQGAVRAKLLSRRQEETLCLKQVKSPRVDELKAIPLVDNNHLI
ncbi:site-specific integrase [Mesorhizobium retamae]|uniref:Site-specific integrase n=1 Tax=Mesorhizobium retamae TaxID=2912854 RepID=A0ABS9QBI1_9HYPH|nr:site-specific integrase [Mesorhizobium sp. IRAMC:0171]MCG7504768.1 site-specific integrase [Mesorhizobium sp. IRAMC:0171]